MNCQVEVMDCGLGERGQWRQREGKYVVACNLQWYCRRVRHSEMVLVNSIEDVQLPVLNSRLRGLVGRQRKFI